MGGGLAAQRCCETLRALGHDGPITIAGAEGSEPYDRPPLSKEGLAGAADPRFRPREWYAEQGVALRLGDAAVRLHPGARTVELADGERLRYDDLLIATGSRPVMLPALAGFANVQALRTLDDAERLREALRAGARLTRDRRRAVRAQGGLQRAPARRGGDRRRGRAAAAARAARPRGRASGWPRGTARTGPTCASAPRCERPRAAARRDRGRRRTAHRGESSSRTAREIGHEDHVVVAVGVRPEAAGWRVGPLAPASAPHSPTSRRGRRHRRRHWEAAARQGAAVARALLGLGPRRRRHRRSGATSSACGCSASAIQPAPAPRSPPTPRAAASRRSTGARAASAPSCSPVARRPTCAPPAES